MSMTQPWSLQEAQLVLGLIHAARNTAMHFVGRTSRILSTGAFAEAVNTMCAQTINFEQIARALPTQRSPELLRRVYLENARLILTDGYSPEMLLNLLNRVAVAQHATPSSALHPRDRRKRKITPTRVEVSSSNQNVEPDGKLQQQSEPNNAHPKKRLRAQFVRSMKYGGLQRFSCFEWFYSDVDYRGFFSKNEFKQYLQVMGISDVAATLTRSEWQFVRRFIEKVRRTRRFSAAFVAQQRKELDRIRAAARAVQEADECGSGSREAVQHTYNQQHIDFEVPAEIPLGRRVTAVHPIHFILATGTVLIGLSKPVNDDADADSLASGKQSAPGDPSSDPLLFSRAQWSSPTYCIHFDDPKLGVCNVPDFLVASHGPNPIIVGTEHGSNPSVTNGAALVAYQDAEIQQHSAQIAAAVAASNALPESPGIAGTVPSNGVDQSVPPGNKMQRDSAVAAHAADCMLGSSENRIGLDANTFPILVALSAAANSKSSSLSNGVAVDALANPHLTYVDNDLQMFFQLKTMLARKDQLVEELKYLNSLQKGEKTPLTTAHRESYRWVLRQLANLRKSLIPVMQQFGDRFRVHNTSNPASHQLSEAWHAAFVRMCNEPAEAIVHHFEQKSKPTQSELVEKSASVRESSESAGSLKSEVVASSKLSMVSGDAVPSRSECLVGCVQLLIALRLCNEGALGLRVEEVERGLEAALEQLVPRCNTNRGVFGKIVRSVVALKSEIFRRSTS